MMKFRHLSANQIARCLIGGAGAEEARHASTCPTCAAELGDLEQSLGEFRDAVHHWSASAGASADRSAWASPRLFAMSMPSDAHVRGRRAARAGVSSILIHAAAVAMAVSIGVSPQVVSKLRVTGIDLYLPPPAKPTSPKGGGGSGGENADAPPTKGKLPKVAPRQFVPPSTHPQEARLIMTPTITVPIVVPDLPQANYGDPLGVIGPLSNGPGSGGGLGSGRGGGIGPGDGDGIGPGANGGAGGGLSGGVFAIGGGVTAPQLLRQVEPEYSEEARKAKWQGTVKLRAVVGVDGIPTDITIVQSPGLGLDERAMEAVRQWRFLPGKRYGKPVPVLATIEVHFQIL